MRLVCHKSSKSLASWQALNLSLPLLLEECTEMCLLQAGRETSIVIDQAVEFLQALLDLLTEHSLHLGVSESESENELIMIS